MFSNIFQYYDFFGYFFKLFGVKKIFHTVTTMTDTDIVSVFQPADAAILNHRKEVPQLLSLLISWLSTAPSWHEFFVGMILSQIGCGGCWSLPNFCFVFFVVVRV